MANPPLNAPESSAPNSARDSALNIPPNSTLNSKPFRNLTPPQGFTDGVMTVGPHAGRKVSEAKPLIREEMLAAGQAMPYSEPEKTVRGARGALGRKGFQ